MAAAVMQREAAKAAPTPNVSSVAAKAIGPANVQTQQRLVQRLAVAEVSAVGCQESVVEALLVEALLVVVLLRRMARLAVAASRQSR